MLSRLDTAARQNLRQHLHLNAVPNWSPSNGHRLSSLASLSARPSLATPSTSSSPCTPRNSRPASTKAAQARDEVIEAHLPRYIRRQGLQKAAEKGKAKTGAGTPTESKEIKLLDPYILAKRLRALCQAGKVDDAVAMLKNSPRDAMNTPVWNTMIWEALKNRRFQLAYKLYVDMKRRGFSPTTRTFQTMFTGLSKIEEWSSHTQQLSNARLLYDAFQRHITSLKKHEPTSKDIMSTPLAAYIKILGDNGEYDEILDVFKSLDKDGPFSPDATVYAATFHAIANMRRVLVAKGITPPEQWEATVAADARQLWTQLGKASKQDPSKLPDAFVATTAISALSRGSTEDHELAFQIAQEYFGLSRDPSNAGVGLHPLTRATFGTILNLCDDAGCHSTSLQLLQQVKERPEAHGGLSIIDRPHMEEILKARSKTPDSDLGNASLGYLEWMLRREHSGHGAHIRPAMSTYNLVLTACWKASDWTSALSAFELMTGYSPIDFIETPSPDSAPPKPRKRTTQTLVPSAEAMSAMMRTALSTRQLRYIQQCLRILQHIGIDHITTRSSQHKKEAKNNSFYGSKLASAVTESVQILTTYKDECVPAELAKWRAFASQCREEFDKTGAGGGNEGGGYTPTTLDREPSKGNKRRLRL
ncbi:hypothetical protein CC1G_00299 [Coprinopsis cinerea okayama7|uniref:Pentatricopeptide repeat protein n=1 Tax=Coprinopsis cinerea (strain Okayama-7 / 130 / ATCC MYA-4618 / FGSC 9003) TaxID=240176 RepID=A8NXG7_COPC7|nr:hypothetical protein CC1G_00299 [Coprinopsis cinerea okayama7\|eukprot:XP_001837163.1 hypothetical protein CC1G_00299 [Coprinopsis cinerea okayama7\